MKKKILSILLSTALAFGLVSGSGLPEKVQAAESRAVESVVQPFTELTGAELIKDMGAGWNLGNTMDGHTGFTPGETIWQNVKTTKKLIKEVHDLGFNTVRIPVTWGTMIDDANDYAIDEAWLGRVQDIVDYCMSQNMYAIINIHHDGADQAGWLRIATEDQAGLEKKFAGVWKNIATAFQAYDEHLILESMNEVTGKNMTMYEENQVIVKLNQIFVDTVRKAGGNNAKRWLMVPGKFNYISAICNENNGFTIPKDSVADRIILSVHDYSPIDFTHTQNQSDLSVYFSVKRLGENDEELKPLYDLYTSKGIPVVVGEYGSKNKGNVTERAFYMEGMNRIFQKYQLVGVYWDQGWYDRSQKPDYSFSIIDRNTGKPIEKEVTDGILRGYFGKDSDYATLTKNPEVKKITSLETAEKELQLTVNETKNLAVTALPADTNDIVLWKTDDPTVATVAYGKIKATGIGQTKITAFSQSGSASLEIMVKVTAQQADVSCTELKLDKTEYTLKEGESAFLGTALSPVETTESLYYRSSNESVVTVSTTGKLVAIGAGEATVKVCTSGGMEKDVAVKVVTAEIAKEIRLSVNVYYNDKRHEYYANEIGREMVTVQKNGQYTLSFDCDTDLSDKAKAAGVSDLNNITAIYIKDYDAATGKAAESAVSACKIRYDKIVVNEQELKIVNQDFKSALKDSGIFDTNDPINSWDGSAVEEVNVSNYVATFPTIANPKKISITFTLDELCFRGSEPEPPAITPAPSPEPTPGPSMPQEKKTVKKGQKVMASSGAYTVTAAKGTDRTVSFTKPASKSAASVTIPATVKIQGKRYKVTSIAAKAFQNMTKLKRVTVGKNVDAIGKEAFSGCKNLELLIIKSDSLTLKKTGKKAFFGVNKKLRIKASKKKAAGYKKIINKKK